MPLPTAVSCSICSSKFQAPSVIPGVSGELAVLGWQGLWPGAFCRAGRHLCFSLTSLCP